MSYYDELVKNIEKLINDKSFDEARDTILKELAMPYVPKDTESKLNELLDKLPIIDKVKSLSDEEIEDYLFKDPQKQLIAIDALNSKNLRDFLDLIDKYLTSDGYINAKALLIDSLIKQEIGDEIHMNNNGLEYTFIPKYVIEPELSLGFTKAIEILSDKYMKEPSKLQLAKQLVYKECLLNLPLNFDEDEGASLANKAYEYIENAFEANIH